jgi:hypothetical protein
VLPHPLCPCSPPPTHSPPPPTHTHTHQDCGNLLWACTVLGILSPEAMELLGGKLLSLRRESFTQEAYIQLYQAKMSLSQQVRARLGRRGARIRWRPRQQGRTRPGRQLIRRAWRRLSKLPASPPRRQVYDIAQYIPPELLSRGEIEWRKQAEVLKVSVTHRQGRPGGGGGVCMMRFLYSNTHGVAGGWQSLRGAVMWAPDQPCGASCMPRPAAGMWHLW